MEDEAEGKDNPVSVPTTGGADEPKGNEGLASDMDNNTAKPDAIKEENGVTDNDESKETPSEENNKRSDPAISERKAWDYSHLRVMIKNILKFMSKRDIKKMLASWIDGTGNKIKITKSKKPPQDPWIVVTVENEDQVGILVDYINKNKLTNKRGETLVAHRVEQQHGVREGVDDRDSENGENNRKRGDWNDGSNTASSKRQRVQRAIENAKPQIITNEELKDVLLPLWRCTYQEQLRKKEMNMVRRSALRIVKEIMAKFRYEALFKFLFPLVLLR